MQGLIFAEFLDFVDQKLGSIPDVPPAGSYSALATYDHAELAGLVGRVSAATGVAAPELLRSFGIHLFGRFAALYPVFFFEADSALGFLGSIETYIHGEVQKLYPGAEFPYFECRSPGAGRLEMMYRSSRALADLAGGLIQGCILHFRETIELTREDLPGPYGTAVRFSLAVKAATGSVAAEGS
jgi:hypothetical protein